MIEWYCEVDRMELQDFIAECRSGKTHFYDIVEGPMANDTVWNYVNDYLTFLKSEVIYDEQGKK